MEMLQSIRASVIARAEGRNEGGDLVIMDAIDQIVSNALRGKPWICFHCGFETTNREEAEAHFGDRDDAEEFTPLCKWWKNMSEGERAEQFQTLHQELNAEREETGNLKEQLRTAQRELGNIVLLVEQCNSIEELREKLYSNKTAVNS